MYQPGGVKVNGCLRFLFIVVFTWPGLMLANGDESAFPLGCEPLVQFFKQDKLVLPVAKGKPQLILIQNEKTPLVWLVNQPIKETKVTQWTSSLCQQRWSALIVQDETLNMACVESRPGSEQYVPCQNVITACIYPKLNTKKKSLTTGWLGENQTFPEIQALMFQQAIEIPGVTPEHLLPKDEKNAEG
ncbi:MAG: hypothetical protein GKR77_01935 [Legionellales bacterium]|nr:hypothetical protein [Legionellales bacterium]